MEFLQYQPLTVGPGCSFGTLIFERREWDLGGGCRPLSDCLFCVLFSNPRTFVQWSGSVSRRCLCSLWSPPRWSQRTSSLLWNWWSLLRYRYNCFVLANAILNTFIALVINLALMGSSLHFSMSLRSFSSSWLQPDSLGMYYTLWPPRMVATVQTCCSQTHPPPHGSHSTDLPFPEP